MEFSFGSGPPKGRRKNTTKTRRNAFPDRRRNIRKDQHERRAEKNRREAQRRHEAAKRKAVAVLRALEMERMARLVKQTVLIEPLVSMLTFVFSGALNFSVFGFAGIAVLLALLPHEFGHFFSVITLRAGFRPHWFRFWGPVGVTMQLPEMTSRSHKARVAFGGPFWGFLFTLLMTVIWLLITGGKTDTEVNRNLFTLPVVSVVLNLFNFITLRPIDGGRMAHGMDGEWPKWLARFGLVFLMALTVLFPFSTLFVVWVLVVGYMSPPKRWAASIDVRMWRYIFSILFTGALLLWIAYDHLHVPWTPAALIGETASLLIALLFVSRYRLEWRFPEENPTEEDTEEESVDPQEGRSMRLKSCALFVALLLNLILLVLVR